MSVRNRETLTVNMIGIPMGILDLPSAPPRALTSALQFHLLFIKSCGLLGIIPGPDSFCPYAPFLAYILSLGSASTALLKKFLFSVRSHWVRYTNPLQTSVITELRPTNPTVCDFQSSISHLSEWSQELNSLADVRSRRVTSRPLLPLETRSHLRLPVPASMSVRH